MTTAASHPAHFVRDRLTWLTYLVNAWGTFSVAALSPLMPFLASDLNLSYTQRGLHTSAFAVGGLVAGVSAERLAQRLPRRVIIWGGGGGLAIAMLALLLLREPVLTVSATFVMGLAAALMFVTAQAALADHQGDFRNVAFTESSVGASIAGLMAPLLISTAEALALGWRGAVLLSPLAFLALLAWGMRIRVPNEPRVLASASTSRRLSRLYWLFWLVMALGSAIEWSVGFWTPAFLTDVVGVEPVTAAGALSLIWLGLIVGRVVGSVLSRRFQPTTLLLGAIGIVLLAFPVLWLARQQTLAFAAIFVMSLGLANFFPLILASATAAGANNINAATGRIALAVNTAILLAPQLLGSLGDQIGIEMAYAGIALIALAMLALCILARWAQRQPSWRTAPA